MQCMIVLLSKLSVVGLLVQKAMAQAQLQLLLCRVLHVGVQSHGDMAFS